LLENVWYYDEKNRIYPKRFDAIKSKRRCHWYYHDDYFRKHDWSKEPQETLSELYRLRAEQIRKDYDYIVLCYSGGIDSTNMLETFYYNNIHIDEILTVGALNEDPERYSDFNKNGDLYHNVFSTLNSMNLTNTKITIMDYTKYYDNLDNFTAIKKYGTDYFKYFGSYASVHTLFWHDVDKFLNTKRRTAYLFGIEKPIFKYEGLDDQYKFFFLDDSFDSYANRYEFENGRRLSFYSDPNDLCIKIMSKQHHMIRNYADDAGVYGKELNDSFLDIIYNVKHPLEFVGKKTILKHVSDRDRFLMLRKNSDMFKFYKESMQKMIKDLPIDEKIRMRTKPYYLDTPCIIS
jgi:hypothetical protein